MSEKLTITSEDLASPTVDSAVDRMKSAQEVQTVRSVGAPTAVAAGQSNWLLSTAASLTLAGLIGGAVGWILSEFLAPESTAESSHAVAMHTALWTAFVAAGVALVLAGWEGFQMRSTAKAKNALARAVPLAVAGGAISGYLAQKIYEPMNRGVVEEAFRRATSEDEFLRIIRDGSHLPRGLGFALFGAVMGLALGAATKSNRRAVNGLLGGAAGGFVGGFVFDYINIGEGDGGANRLIALVITGAVIGLAVGLVENARKEFWLEILSGGMAGKQFILYHEATSVGSSPHSHITLIKDPHIAADHLLLQRTPQGMVASARAGSTVFVNGSPVDRGNLRDGDTVQVGETVLRFGEKAPAPAGSY